MAPASASATLNLGFLTVLRETNGYVGGYLVTNLWGRPLEFRLSTAVQPNRVQKILYAATLQPYIYAELIGKTLIDKTSTPVQLILTDCQPVLDLRCHQEIPVACLALPQDASPTALGNGGARVRSADCDAGPVLCHPRFPADGHLIRQMLERLDGILDLAEPFTRIREALGEARKMGITKRS